MPTKPSKTQRKRDMLALQTMGESLIALSAPQLATIEMPDALRNAVVQAQDMHKHGALYRQKQYIGKLMRGIDCEPIRTGLARLQQVKTAQAVLFKHSETWRHRMLTEGEAAVQEFVASHPQAECQQLHQWIRDARLEKENGKTSGSARQLFRYINKLLQQD